MSESSPNPPMEDKAAVRSFAIAKLRRAASLPRNKDGRRPDMLSAFAPLVAEGAGQRNVEDEPKEKQTLDWSEDRGSFHPSEVFSTEESGFSLGPEVSDSTPVEEAWPSYQNAPPSLEDEYSQEQPPETHSSPSGLPPALVRSTSASNTSFPSRFPTLPSLHDIQSRHLLQRSNSASARQDALSRLTGTHPPPSVPSPQVSRAPTPSFADQPPSLISSAAVSSNGEDDPTTTSIPSTSRPRLGRSFTIGGSNTGGERRSVVGRRMMARLGNRTDSPAAVPPVPSSTNQRDSVDLSASPSTPTKKSDEDNVEASERELDGGVSPSSPSGTPTRLSASVHTVSHPSTPSSRPPLKTSKTFAFHSHSQSESLPTSRSGSPRPFPDYPRPSHIVNTVTLPSYLRQPQRLSNASSSAHTGSLASAFDRQYVPSPDQGEQTDEFEFSDLLRSNSGRTARSISPMPSRSAAVSIFETVQEAPPVPAIVYPHPSSPSTESHPTGPVSDSTAATLAGPLDPGHLTPLDSPPRIRVDGGPASNYSTPGSESFPSIPILPPGFDPQQPMGGSGSSFPASVTHVDEDGKPGQWESTSSDIGLVYEPKEKVRGRSEREEEGVEPTSFPSPEEFVTPLESFNNLSRSASPSTELSSSNSFARKSGSSVSTGPMELGVPPRVDEAMSSSSWVGEEGERRGGPVEKKHGHKKSNSFADKLERLAKGTFRSRPSSPQPRSPMLDMRDLTSPTLNRTLSKSSRSSDSSFNPNRSRDTRTSNITSEDQGSSLNQYSSSQTSLRHPAPSPSNASSPTSSKNHLPNPIDSRYQDAKLMPFPGIARLEKERERKRGNSISSTSPSMDRNGSSDVGTPASYVSPFEVTGEFESAASPGSTQVAYFDLPARAPSPGSKKSWLSRKFSTGALKGQNKDKRKESTVDGSGSLSKFPTSPSTSFSSVASLGKSCSPRETSSPRDSTRILSAAYSPSPSARYSDLSGTSSRASPPSPQASTFPTPSSAQPIGTLPTSISSKSSYSPLVARLTTAAEPSEEGTPRPSTSSVINPQAPEMPAWEPTIRRGPSSHSDLRVSSEGSQPSGRSLQDLYASSILSDYSKDPAALDDPPEEEETDQADNGVDGHSDVPSGPPVSFAWTPKTSEVLGRLDAILAIANAQPAQPSLLNHPPRKLILHSPVLQVVNTNTAKDRYLFLFTDLLVIAKPILAEGQFPSLDNTFLVKSVVELPKLKLSGLKDGDMTLDSIKKQHPIVLKFIDLFSKDPYGAVDYLIKQSNIPTTGIAGFLFKTTELDRTRLGEFLSMESNEQLLKGFVARFSFHDVRIDEALRTFLLSIRLPTEANASEQLLRTFAVQWHEANSDIVTFDKLVLVQLVLAIMQLNDALNPSSSGFGTFAFTNQAITVDDFIQAFRVHDHRRLVTDDYLQSLYSSIKEEKLSQALSSTDAHLEKKIYLLPSQLPSRLTYNVPSEPIYITMPEPDPKLVIKLHGAGLVFDPPVLTFSTQSRASFTVTGKTLGSKTMLMSRTGETSPLYSSLPTSKTFLVERAFQRPGHTFQLAFLREPTNQKRKYLFSFESAETRLQWAGSLQGQIRRASSNLQSSLENGMLSSQVQEAAQMAALQVLRDALIPSDGEGSKGGSGIQRTPSVSQVYPLRAGRGETELDQQLDSAKAGKTPSPTSKPDHHSVTELEEIAATPFFTARTGHQIVRECEQNSLVPLMLSFLQAGVKPVVPSASSPIGLGIGLSPAIQSPRSYGYF